MMKLVGKTTAIEMTETDDMLFTIGGRPVGYDNGRLLWCFTDLDRLNQLKRDKVKISADDSVLFSLGFEPIASCEGVLIWDEVALECLDDYHADRLQARKA